MSEPTTEAGRRLLREAFMAGLAEGFDPGWLVAIEAEARTDALARLRTAVEGLPGQVEKPCGCDEPVDFGLADRLCLSCHHTLSGHGEECQAPSNRGQNLWEFKAAVLALIADAEAADAEGREP